MKTIYQQVEALSLPLIEHYQTDLTMVDKKTIEANRCNIR